MVQSIRTILLLTGVMEGDMEGFHLDKNKKAQLKAAHIEEMSTPAAEGQVLLLTPEQVGQARLKFATLCAQYAACRGISLSYRSAGIEEKAETFSAAAVIAGESVRAVQEILDILGIEHPKA